VKQKGTYLTCLKLKNVKSFKGEHVLNLCAEDARVARWSLILGDNGVGKTTLLQCIAHLAPFRNTTAPDGDPNPEFFIEPVGAEDENNFESFARHGTNELSMSASFVAAGLLDCPPTPRSRVFTTSVEMTRKQGKIESFENSKFADVLKSDPLIIGYGAGRTLGRGNLDPSSAPDALTSLFADRTELVDAEELIQQLDYAALRRKTRRTSRQNEVMKAMLAALLPDIGDAKNIIIHGPSPLTQKGKIGVYARTPYGEVPLNQLSFGYQTMTAWLADIGWRLFRHYPESSNPLLQPAIVLVDEIDLHLHPLWQRQLRDRLAKYFPAVQFIATAHSPLMAQDYMGENLAVVRRDGDHVEILNDPQTVAGWRLDQVITSDLFGFKTSFSIEVERLLEEQRTLVAKADRSADEEERLASLEDQLMALPMEDTEADNKAMEIIRRAAELYAKDPKIQ